MPSASPESRHSRKASDGAAIERAIATAQKGSVRVAPKRALAMARTLFAGKKYAQAGTVCRQILAARPNDAEALNILGVALDALGRGAEAAAALRRAAELAPSVAAIQANAGEIFRRQGLSSEALDVLERACSLDPSNAQALNNLGVVCFEEGDVSRAADHYRRAIDISPDMAEAHNNLGNALRMSGDLEGAIEAYQDALTCRENYPEAYNNLGTLLQQQGRLDEAEHALAKAVAQNAGYMEARANLALLHCARSKDVEALRVLGEALKIAPDHERVLLITARIQLRRGSFAAAEQACRAALQKNDTSVEALTVLGQVLHETDRYEEALEVLEKAVSLGPEDPEAMNFYGVALKSTGRLDEARGHILSALRANCRLLGAYANVSDLVDFSEAEGVALFEEMDSIFASASDPETEQYLSLHFAYAKALDDRGEHGRALQHYITGGRIKRAQLAYEEDETHAFFDQIRGAFPREAFADRRFDGHADDRPVFIVGMPRSGSTLVEQILSSHSKIAGAGEVKYLSHALGRLRDRFPSLPKYPDLVTKMNAAQLEIASNTYIGALSRVAPEAPRITDKLLTNYFFVGLINLMFPNARIIHTRRNPVDTCLSAFTKLFKDDMPHSYDLAELGRYYRKYRELMEHWSAVLPDGAMITVDYENVVADTRSQAQRLIRFLDLEWEETCLDFHKSARPVKTASVAQVRRPIYSSSVDRWKRYGPALQPLLDALGHEGTAEREQSPPKQRQRRSR